MTDVRPTPAAQTRAPVTGKQVATGGLAATMLLAASLAITPLMKDEGASARTYRDVAGIPTACYGHTGPDTGPVGEPHSPAQCQALLTADVRATMTAVVACAPVLGSRPQQLAAATRLAYNIGANAFCASGTASAFRRGDWRKGCDLMLAWDKARASGRLVSVPGLAARRQRERAMCLVGVA